MIIVIVKTVLVSPMLIAKILAIICNITKGQEAFLLSYEPNTGFNKAFAIIPPKGPEIQIIP